MRLKSISLLGVLCFLLLTACTAEPPKEIRSGEIWPDNQGVHVNAHGGGVLYHDGTYYWYGENKSDSTSSAMVGIMCYSSKNLTDWNNEGAVLPVVLNDSTSDIVQGCVMERPKVIYNEKTKKFVMWFHLELKGKGYAAARSAVAVSDSPTGPFKYIRSERINPGVLPFDMNETQRAMLDTLDAEKYKEWWTPMWYEAIHKGLFVKRDLQGGQMARDMQLFVDEDGKAYHIYSSEDNLTLQIAELSDDYLTHTGKYVRMAPAGHNEAPAIFKKSDGTYWMITSGCTGWDPNEARMFSAPSIWGPPVFGDPGHNIQILVVERNQKSLLAGRVPMSFRYLERKTPLSLWQISGGLSIRVMLVISGCPYSLKMECLISNGWIAGRSISLIRNYRHLRITDVLFFTFPFSEPYVSRSENLRFPARNRTFLCRET